MFKTLFLFLSATLIGTSFIGCAVDECEKYAERSVCQTTTPDSGNGGILTISPRRLNIKGDTVVVTMSAKTSATDDVKITQPGMADVALGKLGNGTVKVPALTSSQLSLGKAYLVVGANAPEPIRLYLNPKFVDPMIYSIPGDTPKWVGIGDGQRLIMLSDDNKQAALPLRFLEFPLNNFIAPIEAGRYPRQNVQVATNGQFKFSAHPDGNANPANTVLLRKCQIGAGSCAQEIQTAYPSVTDISVNQAGTLLAVIANQKVDAYSIGASFDKSSPRVSLDGVPNPALVAVGDLSGDGLSDVLIWSNAKFSVFRQMSSSGNSTFTLDPDLAAQINMAIGANAPSQVIIYDVDGDGIEDVVYSDNVQIIWLINMGNSDGGKISFVKSQGTPISIPFNSFAIGDIDQNGKSDLAFVSMSPKYLGYHLNQATY